MGHAVGGVREYARNIVRELSQQASDHRVTVYCDEQSADIGDIPVEVVQLKAPHKLIWDHVVLPARLRRDRPDVVLFLQNTCPWWCGFPYVLMVTDLNSPTATAFNASSPNIAPEGTIIRPPLSLAN